MSFRELAGELANSGGPVMGTGSLDAQDWSGAYGAHIADVEVDPETGKVTILRYTAVQDVGRVMNPVLAAGQVEGGVAQGIGWALLEDVQWENGRMSNATLTDYVIPTAGDAPPVHVVFLEHPHGRAPHGVKGIGELPMDGPAPAVANALRHALGPAFPVVPMTPERVLQTIEEMG